MKTAPLKIWVKSMETGNKAVSDKSMIRKELLKKRDALSQWEREKASVMLTERILGHQWYYSSDTILGFASYGSEIDLDRILEDALQKHKKLFLPKVEGREMVFYRVTGLEELEKGYRGIREPAGCTERFLYDPSDSHNRILMLMPGVAFDLMKNRMGYGGGFYDRFLMDKEKLMLRTIGVGYAMQLLEEIPCEKFDIKPCQVICL